MGVARRSRTEAVVALLVVLVLTGYQLVRIISLVNVYGGIEHDGGWFLSISRSLAERGTYTTLVSTIVDPYDVGGTNIDFKYDIQDEEGRIWFFTGSGTGPASIVPNAVILKIFGFGFWAQRAGPLLFYTVLLLLMALSVYHLGGLPSILLFQAFIFCYPRLSISLSYEAMGEGTTLCYATATFLAFAAGTQTKRHRIWFFVLAGLLGGLAINTKMLAILSIGGILGWAGIRWVLGYGGSRRERFQEMVAFGGVAAVVQVLWELVQLVVLARLTNIGLYLAHLQGRLTFIRDDGSGLGERKHFGTEFLYRKLLLLREVAHPQEWVTVLVFVCIFVGGLALILLWRQRRPYAHNLLAVIWLAWLGNTAWFVSMAKTGWPRHYWFGLMLAVVLLSAIPIALMRQCFDEQVRGRGIRFPAILGPVAGGIGVILVVWGFVRQPHVWHVFLPNAIVPYWLDHRVDYFDFAGLPWVIVTRADQEAVVDYINAMPADARVYYPERHKAAEIPCLTGRIQYPLNRRTHPGVKQHPADIVLVPPSLISVWRFAPVTRQELLSLVEQACPNPVLKNDHYMICLADQVHLP